MKSIKHGRVFLKVLKNRLSKEGSESVTNGCRIWQTRHGRLIDPVNTGNIMAEAKNGFNSR